MFQARAMQQTRQCGAEFFKRGLVLVLRLSDQPEDLSLVFPVCRQARHLSDGETPVETTLNGGLDNIRCEEG